MDSHVGAVENAPPVRDWPLDFARARLINSANVPILRYAPLNTPCRLCGEGFDHHQTPETAPLTSCPTCGQPVSRVQIQPLNTPKLLKPLSVSQAKNLGFSVFKKTSSGEFERQ
jgi:hypothetical protein